MGDKDVPKVVSGSATNIMLDTLLLGCSLLFAMFFVVFVKGRRNKMLPYPPGPPADPIIGHLRIIPKEDRHEVFHGWSKTYGDVMYLEVLGKPMIVLSSEQAASDLLDKRSANYSDRPRFPIHERYAGMYIFLSWGCLK